jgi:type II secretion system protein G
VTVVVNRSVHCSGFTLIEVLIVVVIMAVLAAVIIPQFSTSTTDAKQSSLDFDLHTLRSQIEMYRAHAGDFPAVLSDLAKTTPDGYGPYVDEVPENPFNSSSAEAAVTTVPTGPNSTGEGWLYMKSTGQVWGNCDEGF